MYKELGYVRIGSYVPKIKIANVDYNVDEIIKGVKEAEKNDINILSTPELSLTGYTCGDLFLQEYLINKSLNGIKEILDATKKIDKACSKGIIKKNTASRYKSNLVKSAKEMK